MLNRTSYTLLSTVLAPVAVARLLLLSRKHSGYRVNIGQRFGRVDFATQGVHCLWLHAVSVGEVIGSEPFVNRLLEEYPDFTICITNTTPTGAEQVRRSFGHWGSRVHQSYAPYDLPGSVERFLDQLRPVGLIMMETELWPNWLAATHDRGIPSILMNARMSEKSFLGYQKLGKLGREMLSHLSIVSAQTSADAERFQVLGAQHVQVTGSLKFEFELRSQERELCQRLAEMFRLTTPEQVLVAASTHEGEERYIAESFKQLCGQHPGLKLVLVPRHPERCSSVAAILKENELPYRLRSGELPLDDQHPVLLCDQLGELRAIYGLGKMAFIGGTLVDHGGHNPLEPAAWGSAMVAGPSQRNFHQIFNDLEATGAMKRVKTDVPDMVAILSSLVGDPATIRSAGEAAKAYLQGHRGACEANLSLFREHIGAHIL